LLRAVERKGASIERFFTSCAAAGLTKSTDRPRFEFSGEALRSGINEIKG
jgi:hypothetical protein